MTISTSLTTSPLVGLKRPLLSTTSTSNCKKQKIEYSEEQISSLAKTLLISTNKIKEKLEEGKWLEYKKRIKKKYGCILGQAQIDFDTIIVNYTEQNECNSFVSNNFKIKKDTLLKCIRKSNLKLLTNRNPNIDLNFSIYLKSANELASLIAQRDDNSQLSILLWSGTSTITASNPDYLGAGLTSIVQKVLNVSNGTFGALKAAKKPSFNANIQHEIDLLSLLHANGIAPGLQLPPTNAFNIKEGFSNPIRAYAQHLYKLGDIVTSLNKGLNFDGLQQNKQLEIFRELLSGIKTLHDRNIIHGDIKPDNCFLDKDKSGNIHCYLADLGNAQQVNQLRPTKNNPLGTSFTIGCFTRRDVISLGKYPKTINKNEWLKLQKLRDIFATATTIWTAISESLPYVFSPNTDQYPKTVSEPLYADVVCKNIGQRATNALKKSLLENPYERMTVDQMIEAFGPINNG